jgi:hypothetical protein
MSKTIEIRFHRDNAGDLRTNSPGYGTGILDILSKNYIIRSKMTGYDRFLWLWKAVAKQIALGHSLRAF